MPGFVHALYVLLAVGVVAVGVELWIARKKP